MNSHRSRYQEVAEVLARHGMDVLLAATGLGRWLPSSPDGVAPLGDPAVQLRLTLEDLGPTFVKIGQLLSTRPDLLPPEYVSELAKLQDAAPEMPAEEVRATIRHEFGVEPEELFAAFDWTPIASASIGQVHGATLADGTEVVVKVRRLEAVRQVREDLEILTTLADRAARMWEPAREYDAPGLVREFSRTLRAELDYLQEARNAERFAADFADRPDVIIPRVFRDLTTGRVLTLERMSGIKINDRAALDAAGIDRHELARTGADIVLDMVFEHGFFHADLHPGNLFVRTDGIALIDFGMVGEISESLQDQLADVFIASATANADDLADALITLSVSAATPDRRALRARLASLLARYSDLPLGEIHFSGLATELLRVMREQHLQLPSEISLVIRVLIETEGVGVEVDPEFTLNTVMTPYARRLVARRFSGRELLNRLGVASRDAGALLIEGPTRLRRLLERMDEDGLELHLRAAELSPIVARAERMGNRVVAGVLTAALINGIGQLVSRDPRHRNWMSALLGAGMTAGAALSGYLVWTSRRRGR